MGAKVLIRVFLALAVVAGAFLLTSADGPAFTEQSKAYYLSPAQANFVRPWSFYICQWFWGLTIVPICVSLVLMKHGEAVRRRQKLVSALPPAAEILRGSLLKRTIRHKRGCPKCERGGGHLVWVLTIGYAGGVTKQYCIRPEMKPQVERWLNNYRELKAKLEAICETNHALLRPEE